MGGLGDVAVRVLCVGELPSRAPARPASEADAPLPPGRIPHPEQGVAKLVPVHSVVPGERVCGETGVPQVACLAHFHLMVEVEAFEAGACVWSAKVDTKVVRARLAIHGALA